MPRTWRQKRRPESGRLGAKALNERYAQNVNVFVSDHCLGCGMRAEATWPLGWAVTAIDIDELDLRDTAAITAMVASQSRR